MTLTRAEKKLRVGRFELMIRELSAEEEAKVKVLSQVWNSRKKMPEMDQGRLDAAIVVQSVVPSTWPTEEFGPQTVENVMQLPSKYVRKILLECQRLNTLDQDIADFLDTQSSSAVRETPSLQS